MTDTMETINCPACGKIMQKIILQGGFAVDICADGCGGMFFDNKEIAELNTSEKDIQEIKNLLEGKIFNIVDENKTRICPACGTKMAKTRALGVQIDTCYNCNGVFLDKGELELVRTHFKKRIKPQTVSSNNGDINLRDFYKDAQDEKFLQEEGYRRIRKIAFGRRRLSLFDIILELIF